MRIREGARSSPEATRRTIRVDPAGDHRVPGDAGEPLEEHDGRDQRDRHRAPHGSPINRELDRPEQRRDQGPDVGLWPVRPHDLKAGERVDQPTHEPRGLPEAEPP